MKTCPICGEYLTGDGGYNIVWHCPNAPEAAWWFKRPDEQPVYCNSEDDDGEDDL